MNGPDKYEIQPKLKPHDDGGGELHGFYGPPPGEGKFKHTGPPSLETNKIMFSFLNEVIVKSPRTQNLTCGDLSSLTLGTVTEVSELFYRLTVADQTICCWQMGPTTLAICQPESDSLVFAYEEEGSFFLSKIDPEQATPFLKALGIEL